MTRQQRGFWQKEPPCPQEGYRSTNCLSNNGPPASPENRALKQISSRFLCCWRELPVFSRSSWTVYSPSLLLKERTTLIKKNAEEGQRRSCPSLFSSWPCLDVASSPSVSLFLFFLCVCQGVRERGEGKEEKRKTRTEGGRKGVCVWVYVYLNACTFIHDYVQLYNSAFHENQSFNKGGLAEREK